jgi:hypothetical protein
LSENKILEGVDLVIVHEWNDPSLVRRIGWLRSAGDAASSIAAAKRSHRMRKGGSVGIVAADRRTLQMHRF